MTHQFLLHSHRRSGVVQPRAVGVAEGVLPHTAVLPGCLPPLLVQQRTLAVWRRTVGQTPDSLPGAALRALHQTASSRTDIVLLDRSRVEVTRNKAQAGFHVYASSSDRATLTAKIEDDQHLMERILEL